MEWHAWLEENLLECSIKNGMGLPCPGCGFQRSLVALLKGEIVESILLFPALFPLLILVGYLLLHLKFQFPRGAKILLIGFCVTTSVMVISWLAKLFNMSESGVALL